MPKRSRVRTSGRVGFFLLIFSMSCTAVFLTICAGNRTEGIAWRSLDRKDVVSDLPSGFMVVDMSSAYDVDNGSVEGEELLGIGPLPVEPAFDDDKVLLKEVADSSVSRTSGEADPDVPMLPEAAAEVELKEEVAEKNSSGTDKGKPSASASVQSDVKLVEERADWLECTVHSGETLTDISRRYGVSASDITKANALSNPDYLSLGQILLIPRSSSAIPKVLAELKKRKQEEETKLNVIQPLKVVDYVVKKGDSLWTIANSFNLSIDTLFGSNSLRNPDSLKPGMKLRVPNQDGIFYKVVKGDTLGRITKKYGIRMERVRHINDISVTSLQIGQEIFLPGAQQVASSYNTKTRRSGSKKGTRYSRSFSWPVVGHINSPFGWRRHPISRRRSFHTGIDIRGRRGKSIRAAKAGRVSYAGWMGGYGRVVVIRHGSGYSTLYAHCSRLLVRKGQKISAGQIIAKVGSSGRSTGPHLHFEVRLNNKPINPLRVLR